MSNINRKALADLMEGNPIEYSHIGMAYEQEENQIASFCVHESCKKKALHNFPGKFPKYCSTHALKGMKSHPRRRCAAVGCEDFAIYSQKKHRTTYGIYCKLHKPSKNYTSVIRRQCKKCKKMMPILIKKICGNCSKRSMH